ncbi:MAG TPA: glycosyltransferase family 2 protein [archaeon]|nr:glycosyltransferase family 2 protein [archaeon]
MKASIILPAYNEGKNIGKVIRAVKKTGDHEIIVVDDGSKDNTLDIAKSEGCVCVRLNKNRGKGFACKTGAKIATNSNLVFIDSDGQLDAKQIPSLLATLKSCDIAVGVRNLNDIPIQRKFSNKFARSVVSAAAGKKLGDVLCGFRAIRKNDLFNLQLKKGRYEFEAEMIIKAVRKGLKIKEVPVSVRYGIGSSMPVTESAKVTSYVLGAALNRVL